MRTIEASHTTSASKEKVWAKWKSLKPWNHWDEGGSDLKANTKGHVRSKKGKAVPYQILDVKEKESFTVMWKALFVKLIFVYKVISEPSSTIVTYQVNLKGFFALPVYFLIRKKIEKNLKEGLKAFIHQIETH